MAGPALAAACGLLFAVSSATVQAGIFRQLAEDLHIVKKEPQPGTPGAPGGQALPRQGFACCNLHFDGDEINDANYSELPMIAAGTPIEVLSYGRNDAAIKVDGKPMKLDHKYGRKQETLDAWVSKLVVNDDPRRRFNTYPPIVRSAIEKGQVVVGMTREQAIASVGYPLTSENASLDGPVWREWQSRHDEYQLNFQPGSDGKLTAVTGDESVTSAMIYKPGR
ncbi:MAG: hypothetical protein JO361_00980 [Gammaproteobacteria bacterium]|nr:hypothetical protein [Gammaproteobacteria bacterium]